MSEMLVLPDSIAGQAIDSSAVTCSWTSDGRDAACVHVGGELDLATAPRLEQALRQPQLDVGLVVLDLRGLEFIDSCGVHAIVNASLRARRVGRRLVVLPGPPNVNRMFAFAGCADGVEIADVDSLDPPVRAALGLAGEDLAL